MENRHTLDLLTIPPELNKNFGAIYAAAKAQRRDALELLLLNEDYCIDPTHHLQTPAARLATAGHFASAELLIELGANRDWTAEGAILGGHVTFAEKIRKVYGANPGYIAGAACRVGNVAYAEWLREHHDAPVWHLVIGAAYRGDLAYALTLCDSEKNSESLQLQLFEGLALGGHYELLKQHVLTCYSDNEEETNRIWLANIHHFGMSGHLNLIEQWIEENQLAEKITAQFNASEFANSAAQNAIQGLLKGNYYAEALAFIEKYRPQTFADTSTKLADLTESFMLGAIYCGHLSTVKRLMPPKASPLHFQSQTHILMITTVTKNKKMLQLAQPAFDAICLFQIKSADDFHFFIETIFNSKDNKHLALLSECLLRSPSFANEKNTLRVLSFIDDHELINLLTASIMKTPRTKPIHLRCARVDVTLHPSPNKLPYNFANIAKRAIKINILRHKYFFDFDEANAFLHQQDLRNLLALAPQILRGKSLPPELASIFLNQLCQLPESFHFLEKYETFFYAKAPILNDLDKYINGWWIDHRERAISLRDAIRPKKNRAEVQALIAYQHGLFTGKQRGSDDTTKPKHEQAVENKNFDDAYYRILQTRRST